LAVIHGKLLPSMTTATTMLWKNHIGTSCNSDAWVHFHLDVLSEKNPAVKARRIWILPKKQLQLIKFIISIDLTLYFKWSKHQMIKSQPFNFKTIVEILKNTQGRIS
jgi:hypothetical protein